MKKILFLSLVLLLTSSTFASANPLGDILKKYRNKTVTVEEGNSECYFEISTRLKDNIYTLNPMLVYADSTDCFPYLKTQYICKYEDHEAICSTIDTLSGNEEEIILYPENNSFTFQLFNRAGDQLIPTITFVQAEIPPPSKEINCYKAIICKGSIVSYKTVEGLTNFAVITSISEDNTFRSRPFSILTDESQPYYYYYPSKIPGKNYATLESIEEVGFQSTFYQHQDGSIPINVAVGDTVSYVHKGQYCPGKIAKLFNKYALIYGLANDGKCEINRYDRVNYSHIKP